MGEGLEKAHSSDIPTITLRSWQVVARLIRAHSHLLASLDDVLHAGSSLGHIALFPRTRAFPVMPVCHTRVM